MTKGRCKGIKTSKSFHIVTGRQGLAGRRVKVKICGIADTLTALAAVEAGADALGFVFAASHRRVTPEVARRIIQQLPPFVSRVGVFVNTPPAEVTDIAAYCGLTAIQLSGDDEPEIATGNYGGQKAGHLTGELTGDGHGDPGGLKEIKSNSGVGVGEPGCPLDCTRCHGRVNNTTASNAVQPGKQFYCSLPVIKTLRVGGDRGLPQWPRCQAAAYLFDTYKEGTYGGTGEAFDWRILQNVDCPKPVILAGGLNAANVRAAVKLVKPYVVDVSGGVETGGHKDICKIKDFIVQAKGVLI